MQIVRDLAGYSMGRSDLVRRAMAKKKHDVMAQEKQHFIYGLEQDGKLIVPGCVRNGVPEAVAEQIFDEMTAFASYAFNKSHAAAYAVVAVQTAYLKLHYPVEFMAALMNSMTGNTAKIAYYIQALRKKGVPVLPPDVNKSQGKFSVDFENGKKGVRFGLAGIKNLGQNAIAELVAERECNGAYSDIYDFINRNVNHAINKKAVESMIRAGAFDCLSGKRSQKLHVYEKAMDGANKQQKSVVAGQISLFDMSDMSGEGSVQAPPPPMPDLKEFDLKMLLQMEREMTGVYISGHPLDEYAQELSRLSVNARFLEEISEQSDHGMAYDQKTVRMGGLIAERKLKASKSGSMMAFVQLEDLFGVTEVLVFPKVYDRVSTLLQTDEPVLMSGKLSVREDEAPKLLLDRLTLLRNASEVEKPDAPAPNHPRSAAQSERKLYLKLREEQHETVLNILSETPGRIPVVLVELTADGGRKALQAPREYWVDEGYDFGALAKCIGADSIVLK